MDQIVQDIVARMLYRTLGKSGLVVSAVGIGCNNFGSARMSDDGIPSVVNTALDNGVTLFDTSNNYGIPGGRSEELLGAALKGRREEAVVATKFGGMRAGDGEFKWDARGGRGYIMRSVEGSLRRLGTGHIDLLQIHVPDPVTPIEETLSALHDLVQAGKVRYLGHSNFSAWQTADAAWTATTRNLTPFVSAQNEYSLLDRAVEAELLPACERFGVGVLPYFPLASGLLTGKYRRDEQPVGRLSHERFAPALASAPWDTLDKLREYAVQRGHSMTAIAIGGLLARPAVSSVIAGATTPEQVLDNITATTWAPSEEDISQLFAMFEPHSQG